MSAIPKKEVVLGLKLVPQLLLVLGVWVVAFVIAFFGLSFFNMVQLGLLYLLVNYLWLCVRYRPLKRTGVVVVTGASTGIGKASVLTLIQNGFHVFAGLRKQQDVENLKKEIQALGNKQNLFFPVIVDVTKENDVRGLEARVAEWLESHRNIPFLSLVNNAGIACSGPVECLDIDMVRSVYEVNVVGLISVTKAFLPLLRKHHGRILNISSISGLLAPQNHAAYNGTKWALEGITASLKAEIRSQNVEVISINPGQVKTSFLGSGNKTFGKKLLESPQDVKNAYKDFFNDLAIDVKMVDSGLDISEGAGPEIIANEILMNIRAVNPNDQNPCGTLVQVIGTSVLRYLPYQLQEFVINHS